MHEYTYIHTYKVKKKHNNEIITQSGGKTQCVNTRMLDCACKIREQFAMVIVAKVLHSFRLRGKPLFRNCFSCIGAIMPVVKEMQVFPPSKKPVFIKNLCL